MKEKPNTPFPANAETIDKSQREAAKQLIDAGAEYSIGGIGPETEELLKKEKAGEWTNTLGEWIKLHKTIACTRDFLDDSARDFFDAEKRSFVFGFGKVFFIDKEGNIAAFALPALSAVGDLKKMGLRTAKDYEKWIENKMTELNFVNRQEQIYKRIVEMSARYKKHLEEQEKTKKIKEFDF